jgi:multidrug efflux pump subunit AcrA (membrane-fusion protein)
MTRVLALPFLALLTLPPQGPTSSGSKPGDATTATARRGTLRSVLERDGRLVPAEATAMAPVFESWSGELEIQELAAHGASVNQGDILVRYDASKLEEQLRSVELDLAQAQQRAQIALDELRLAEQEEKDALTRAERDVEWARRRLKGYLEKEREFEKEGDRLGRQMQSYGLEDQQDELAQLEKMYKEDELVDATEEIVLKRTRRRLAQSQAQINLSNRRSDYRFELEFAIKLESTELEVATKVAALERQQRGTELKRAGRTLTQEKSRFDLEKQRTGVERLRRDRDRLTVRAPHAGMLLHGDPEAAPAKSAWKKGTRAAPNAVQLFVAKSDKYEIVLDVPEPSVLQARSGKAAESALTAIPGQKLVGSLRVDWLPSSRDGNTNLYRARIAVAESDARFRSGLSCKTRIVLDEAKDAVIVPKQAVQGQGDDARVRAARTPEGPFEERKVVLGIDDGKDVVIKSGLDAGELVQLEKKGV